MTNAEKIRNMTDDELASYIQAVFIAGKLSATGKINNNEYEDYKEWLGKEADGD